MEEENKWYGKGHIILGGYGIRAWIVNDGIIIGAIQRISKTTFEKLRKTPRRFGFYDLHTFKSHNKKGIDLYYLALKEKHFSFGGLKEINIAARTLKTRITAINRQLR